MTIFRPLALLAALTLVGCPVATSADDDAGAPDAGPEICDGVDRSCPAELPGRGARCEGDLECSYSVLVGCVADDEARCVDGRWTYAGFCLPGPVLYEACRAPEAGPFPGVDLTVTEPTGITWGLQGGAMLDVRLSLSPPEDAPRCASVRIATTFEGMPTEVTHAVRIPCGRDVLIQTILPSAPCDERLYPYSMDVEIDGVGTQHLEGMVMGGPPTSGAPSPCSFMMDDAGVADGGV